jgi:AcrR family transcriptional regulator
MDDATVAARVLDAADRLFYDHGIRTVGMDQVRDASGVSLKRLYRLFPAKESLVEAVLRQRDLTFRAALAAHVAALPAGRARLMGVFTFLYDWFAEPGYRGCPFVNAFGEMGATSAGVASAVTQQKAAFEEFLAGLVAEAGGPPSLTAPVFILANGAMVAAAVKGSPEPARQARRAVEALLGPVKRPAG